MNKSNLKGSFFALGAACLFGTLPLLTTLGCSCGLGTYTTIALKSLAAMVILSVVVLREKGKPKPERKTYLTVMLLAILNTVLTQVLLFASYRDIAIGTATSLHFTYPIIVLLAGTVFCRERITGKTVLCFGIILLGIALLYVPSKGDYAIRGSVLAICSGIVYGSYCFLLEKTGVLEKISNARFLLVLNSVGLVFGLILSICTEERFNVILPGGVLLALLSAVGPGILASAFYQNGTRMVGSRTTALLGTMEPVVSILLGVLILKEDLTIRAAMGSAAIVSASILMVVLQNSQNPPDRCIGKRGSDRV